MVQQVAALAQRLMRHDCNFLCRRRSYADEGVVFKMLSQKSRYSIRALQYLAKRYGEGYVPLGDIAEDQNIPAKFLTVILSEFSRTGIIATQRGRDGGYRLAIPPIDIRYGDIIRLTRGSLALVPCASRFAHEKCKNCVEEEFCSLRALMLQVRDETASILDRITLADPIKPAI